MDVEIVCEVCKTLLLKGHTQCMRFVKMSALKGHTYIVCDVSQTLLFKKHTAYDVCKTFYYYRTQCMCETRISVSYI